MIRKLMLSAAILSLAACGGQEAPAKNAGGTTEIVTDQGREAPAAAEKLFAFEDAYVRAPLNGKSTTAAYFTLKALTDNPASIISVTTPDAETAELHTHVLDGATMAMRKVDYIEVPIGGVAKLQPMSDHIMLFGVSEDLEAGDTVMLEVTILSNGEPVAMTIPAPVRPLG